MIQKVTVALVSGLVSAFLLTSCTVENSTPADDAATRSDVGVEGESSGTGEGEEGEDSDNEDSSVEEDGAQEDSGTYKDASGIGITDGYISDATDTGSDVDPTTLPKFSFFVTSLKALQELSNNQEGFGGDLRYGETGPGAGLRGADKICATIAERSMAGSSAKLWRAFLSVTSDENGKQINAIDRVGNGPWYDRLGRLLANSKTDLLSERPNGCDPQICDDLPNEDGVPNHQPDSTQPEVDNHDMLTGSDTQGRLYSSTATCNDWTSAIGSSSEGKPRVGHSWPRGGMSGGGRPGGGGGGGDEANSWMSAMDVEGCAAGVNLTESMGREKTVGGEGGYGGFYCFALTP